MGKPTVAVLGAATMLLAGCGAPSSGSTSSGPVEPTASPTASPTAGSTASPTARSTARSTAGTAVGTCRPDRLTALTIASGSTMSQPYVRIALRNDTSQPCRVRGYPGLIAFGGRQGEAPRPVRIAVRRGPLYEQSDAGPRTVVLAPGSSARFSVGTATAYGGGEDLVVIRRLRIRLPGTRKALPLAVYLPASHPARRAVPVRVTALQPAAPR